MGTETHKTYTRIDSEADKHRFSLRRRGDEGQKANRTTRLGSVTNTFPIRAGRGQWALRFSK